jgi:hypothetical protein
MEDRPDTSQAADKRPHKRPYEAPRLRKLGSVAAVTGAGGGTVSDGAYVSS